MTFKQALELYERASGSNVSDYLFDGKENREAELDAVYNAFGIVEEDVTCICNDCIHEDECPFASDADYGTVITECNFNEVSG